MVTEEKKSWIDYLESGLSVVSKTFVSMNIILLIGQKIGEKFFNDDNNSKKTINKISIVLSIICISVFLSQLLHFINSKLENVNLNSYVIESIFWWFIMFAVLLVFVPSDQMELSGGSSVNVSGSIYNVATNAVSGFGTGATKAVESVATGATKAVESVATGATKAASTAKRAANSVNSAANNVANVLVDKVQNVNPDFTYEDGKGGIFTNISTAKQPS